MTSRRSEKLAAVPLVGDELADDCMHAPLLVEEDMGKTILDETGCQGETAKVGEVVHPLGNEVARLRSLIQARYAVLKTGVSDRTLPVSLTIYSHLCAVSGISTFQQRETKMSIHDVMATC